MNNNKENINWAMEGFFDKHKEKIAKNKETLNKIMQMKVDNVIKVTIDKKLSEGKNFLKGSTASNIQKELINQYGNPGTEVLSVEKNYIRGSMMVVPMTISGIPIIITFKDNHKTMDSFIDFMYWIDEKGGNGKYKGGNINKETCINNMKKHMNESAMESINTISTMINIFK